MRCRQIVVIVLCCWEAREELLPFVYKLGDQALKLKTVSDEGNLAGFCSALCRSKGQ